jgi:hypothetical protein
MVLLVPSIHVKSILIHLHESCGKTLIGKNSCGSTDHRLRSMRCGPCSTTVRNRGFTGDLRLKGPPIQVLREHQASFSPWSGRRRQVGVCLITKTLTVVNKQEIFPSHNPLMRRSCPPPERLSAVKLVHLRCVSMDLKKTSHLQCVTCTAPSLGRWRNYGSRRAHMVRF